MRKLITMGNVVDRLPDLELPEFLNRHPENQIIEDKNAPCNSELESYMRCVKTKPVGLKEEDCIAEVKLYKECLTSATE